MSVLIACTNGNWTSSSTWAVVDSTSIVRSENTATTLSTTESSNRAASGTTPGAITVDGFALFLAAKLGSTGTFTAQLYNLTDTAIVAGTAVTVNVSDLPTSAAADVNGGWFFFKFGAPVTLPAGKVIIASPVTSNANQVSLFRSATSGDWAKALRTTTTAAPSAGDDVIVTKEWTAAATGTSRTVTMDSTAGTDYGSATTSQVTPAVAVCQGGTLSYGTSASTNYVLRLSGCAIVYSGGTLNVGSSGLEIPRTSTAVLEFDCASDGDFGLLARNVSAVNVYGLSRTSGKNIVWALLGADASANATSLTLSAGPAGTASAADTGWLDNDVIAVASTVRFATGEQSELGALNGAAGASSITVDGFGGTGGGVLYAHSGLSATYTAADGQTYPYSMQAEVINLTRNVKIRGVSSSADGYMYVAPTAVVVVQWAEFVNMGGAASTAGKRGVDIDTSTGSCSITYCSFHDARTNGIVIGNATTNFSNVTLQHLVFWNMNTSSNASAHMFYISKSTNATSWTVDDIVAILSYTSGYSFRILGVAGTISNIRGASLGSAAGGCFAVGPNILSVAACTIGTMSGITIHSNRGTTSIGTTNFGLIGEISNVTSYRNGGSVYLESEGSITINNLLIWGDLAFGLGASTNTSVIVNGGFLAADSTYSGNLGIWWDRHLFEAEFKNFDISPTQGILRPLSYDFAASGSAGDQASLCRIKLNNCYSGGTNRTSLVVPYQNMYIVFDNLNRVAGRQYAIVWNGILESDITATGDVGHTPSSKTIKLTPSSATQKLATAPNGTGLLGIQIPAIATSAPNVGAWIKKSAAYNGNQPRLRVRSNPSIGINSDTTIATGSGGTGSWELLSGTLPTSTGSGLYEVYVDCDGTAGTLNVDFVQNNMAFWDDGLPTGYGHIFYGRLG